MKNLISAEDKVPDDFRLVGRVEEMESMFSILMRQKASSIAIIGPGGVGCSTLAMGLHATKNDDYAPFDIANKRFYWLDVENLFSSHNSNEIIESFSNISKHLCRSHDNVLIIDNTRGFVDGARANGCESILNRLMSDIQARKYQVVMEVNDTDIPKFYSIHANIRS